jgi:hypothetical protein
MKFAKGKKPAFPKGKGAPKPPPFKSAKRKKIAAMRAGFQSGAA